MSPPVLIATGLAPSRRCPHVVPGTNTKGRKRFRLSFSPQALHFQTLFLGAVKAEAADVTAKVAVPPGRQEPPGHKDALDVGRLPRPDLDQNTTTRRQVGGSAGCDDAIGVEAVGSS